MTATRTIASAKMRKQGVTSHSRPTEAQRLRIKLPELDRLVSSGHAEDARALMAGVNRSQTALLAKLDESLGRVGRLGDDR
jgi:hypothetical protein